MKILQSLIGRVLLWHWRRQAAAVQKPNPTEKGDSPMGQNSFAGPCCACGQERPLKFIMLVDYKGPTPGKGWGCIQCGLPADGAVAIICQECAIDLHPVHYVCTGFPDDPGRVELGTLTEKHVHDFDKHPELNALAEAITRKGAVA